jgi:small subunit ribosomal protein S3
MLRSGSFLKQNWNQPPCRALILSGREPLSRDYFYSPSGFGHRRKGAEIDKMKEELSKMTGKEVYVEIQEVKRPEMDAQLVAENIALQLERRVSFRRAMKRSIQVVMDAGAQGVKIRCSGRLGGAELSRSENYHQGRVPLHTLRANIDYGFAEAQTLYGKIGVKCWVCTGEMEKKQISQQTSR